MNSTIFFRIIGFLFLMLFFAYFFQFLLDKDRIIQPVVELNNDENMPVILTSDADNEFNEQIQNQEKNRDQVVSYYLLKLFESDDILKTDEILAVLTLNGISIVTKPENWRKSDHFILFAGPFSSEEETEKIQEKIKNLIGISGELVSVY